MTKRAFTGVNAILVGMALTGMSACSLDEQQVQDNPDGQDTSDQAAESSSGTQDEDQDSEAPGSTTGESTQDEDNKETTGTKSGSPDESSEPDKDDTQDSKSESEKEEKSEDCPGHPKGPDCDATDIKGKLECIPGLKIVESTGNSFVLDLEQLVDPSDPRGPTFAQRFQIKHRGFDKPLILGTSGYSGSRPGSELTSYISANQLQIEHRNFGSSAPKAEPFWEHLTIENSARDFHEIYKALKWIYPKPWVSTGASKGGETALFFRRFYPCDIDATVAYVAPIVAGEQDPRFNDFLENVGGDELKDCRERLKSVQRGALEERETFIGKLDDGDFKVLGGSEIAFEHQVIEFPFTFFQSGKAKSCNKVPKASASPEEKYRYLNKIHSIGRLKDRAISRMRPYFVQAARQLGAPSSLMEHIKEELKHEDTYIANQYLPKDAQQVLDHDSMKDIREWVLKKGERIILIYGEYDPWTAAKLEVDEDNDSYRYIAPKGAHGSQIRSLPKKQRDEAVAHLKRWLEP